MITKQSIKQFIKPDWRKVLLAIIIYLGIAYFIIKNIVCLAMIDASCLLNINIIEKIIDGSVNFSIDISVLAKIIVLFLAIPFLVFYLISCFLISIWDKIKPKKPVV